MEISIAYSPDTDDAFMMQALKHKKVDCGRYDFSFYSEDIQVLNNKAKKGIYDVTAISVAAYPCISATHKMLTVGASVGDNFGPAIIISQNSTTRNVEELRGKKIAIPGLLTSAFFATRGLIGNFIPVEMNFLEIAGAVRSGAVDAGILIHEKQLDPTTENCVKLADLGKLWFAEFNLPLPLGANAIKRDLGDDVIAELSYIMRSSIEYGFANRKETLKLALNESGAEIDMQAGEKYIKMYVNEDSLDLNSSVMESIKVLFSNASKNGLCQSLDLNNCIV